ncbi:PREDICTED: probable protein phosphatase 2C 4 [Ipomoea nil]|uniref:probable protein phosphatase 2C 4 n=1 Tax=Ipomoea nil TaxID=35883 RepID=UPI000901C441|nr:PREDICTED: probable protein phosphatase 2C 4 [Ipomoea nil]
MGNGIGRLNHCFAGDAGEISRRRHDIAVNLSDPLDEGLGHSFCYIKPDPSSKTQPFSSDDSCSSATTTITSNSSMTTAFHIISGASISANTSTPLSTALVDLGPYNEKASAFESSQFFSSIPLHPIPRNSIASVRSGPIPGVSAFGSGPIAGGFFSGPIAGGFLSGPINSGPLENQYDQVQRYKPKSKKWKFIHKLKKVLSNSLSKDFKDNEIKNSYGVQSHSGNCLSSQASIAEEEDDGMESFRGQNVQWAQGKAGEDRVHVVISEEHDLVFVGIYDGFNGPDATDFLLQNLYTNVFKELKGLLWNEKPESSENLNINEDFEVQNQEFDQLRRFREKLNNLKLDGMGANTNHSSVLNAISEGLRKTEASYLEITDMMLNENPELALMGSCLLVMLMKGQDVYLMNVGDSRAVLAQKPECDHSIGKTLSDEALYRAMSDRKHNLSSHQLTVDHSTSTKEEVNRIKREHPDDSSAIKNGRVKGSLKVTRAFGAGYLKQPKWNNALLEAFQIDYKGNSPYINCLPSLHHHKLGPKDKFLILSSDGLYQYFTNAQAVSEVETFMSIFPDGDPAQHLIEEVIFRAAKKAGMDFHELLDIPQGQRRRYHDDVSIIVISLEGKLWQSSM